jgi:ketosteroid isomerase-like protein
MLIASSVYSQSAEEYKTKIQTLNKEMVKSMLEGNIEKNLALYAKDAISLPNYEPMIEGVDAIRAANKKMMESGYKINSFEPTTLKVIPNGNMITEIGTYKINLNVPGMDQPVTDAGKYLTIWEKQKDGSLKIKVETWNSDTNPMMQQAGSGNPQ